MSCIQIIPHMQNLLSIELSTVKVHNNDLVMNTWDYDYLIMIGPFIGLILINDMSISKLVQSINNNTL